jgi:AcrR family transcriptional regulator
MARKRVEVRQEEILTATVECMKQRGLVATRVLDVARALGISTGLVFYHFESREKLVAAAFLHAARGDLDRLEALDRRRAPAADRLNAMLKLYGPTGDALGWRLWIDGWSEAMHDADLADVLREFDVRWRGALTELIRVGVASGEFRCADPVRSAGKISALIDGLAVQIVVRHSLSRAKARTWIEEFVAAELDLVGAEGAVTRAV